MSYLIGIWADPTAREGARETALVRPVRPPASSGRTSTTSSTRRARSAATRKAASVARFGIPVAVLTMSLAMSRCVPSRRRTCLKRLSCRTPRLRNSPDDTRRYSLIPSLPISKALRCLVVFLFHTQPNNLIHREARVVILSPRDIRSRNLGSFGRNHRDYGD